MAKMTTGKKTSEYAVAQSGGKWGVIALVLGVVIQLGSMITQSQGSDSTIGLVVGACVSVAGIVLKTLTSLGYIKSRTDVKVSAEDKK